MYHFVMGLAHRWPLCQHSFRSKERVGVIIEYINKVDPKKKLSSISKQSDALPFEEKTVSLLFRVDRV